MKDMTLGQKMRWIAGGMYGVLCVYLMFSMRFLLIFSQNVNPIGIANYPAGWFIQLLLVFATGGVAVWLFSGKEVLSDGVRRAVVVLTALIIVFELISYSSQTELVLYSLYISFPKMAENEIWPLVFIIIRLLLYILAAFFITSSKDDYELEEENDEDDDQENEEEDGKEETSNSEEDSESEEKIDDNTDEVVIIEETIVIEETEEEK